MVGAGLCLRLYLSVFGIHYLSASSSRDFSRYQVRESLTGAHCFILSNAFEKSDNMRKFVALSAERFS